MAPRKTQSRRKYGLPHGVYAHGYNQKVALFGSESLHNFTDFERHYFERMLLLQVVTEHVYKTQNPKIHNQLN